VCSGTWLPLFWGGFCLRALGRGLAYIMPSYSIEVSPAYTCCSERQLIGHWVMEKKVFWLASSKTPRLYGQAMSLPPRICEVIHILTFPFRVGQPTSLVNGVQLPQDFVAVRGSRETQPTGRVTRVVMINVPCLHFLAIAPCFAEAVQLAVPSGGSAQPVSALLTL
jgi:hypothetical protein